MITLSICKNYYQSENNNTPEIYSNFSKNTNKTSIEKVSIHQSAPKHLKDILLNMILMRY